MLKDYIWSGHKLFVDSFYCNPLLVQYLYFKDTYVIRITKVNKKGLPKEKINYLHLEENECITF